MTSVDLPPDGDVLSETERLQLFDTVALHGADGVLIARAERTGVRHQRRARGGPYEPGPRISFANDGLCRLSGFTAEELCDHRLSFMTGPSTDREAVRQLMSDLETAGTAEADLTLHRKDGEPIRVLVKLQALVGDGGEDLVVGSYQELTDKAASDHWFRALIENVTDLILVVAADATLTYISPAAQSLLGYDPVDVAGRAFSDFVDVGQHPDMDETFADVISKPGARQIFGMNVRDADGAIRLLQASVTNRLHDPLVRGLVVACRDVTEQDRAEHLLAEQAELLESIARGVPLGVTLERLARMLEERLPGSAASIGVLDAAGVIRHPPNPSLPDGVVDAMNRWSPVGDLSGLTSHSSKAGPLVADVERDAAWIHIRAPLAVAGLRGAWLYRLVAPADGRQLGHLTVLLPTADGPTAIQASVCERVEYLAAIAIERWAYEDRLRHQAMHDALTGLPNRAMLIQRATDMFDKRGRARLDVAMLFIDLDLFKLINDSLGHVAGDEVLDQVARRLRAAVRPSDFVGRFGGDEFVVLGEHVGGVDGAIRIVERLAEELAAPFSAAGASVVLTASIGIARAIDTRMEVETLIRNADLAMYRAKELGRDGYVLFEDSLHRRVADRLSLEQDLRQALASDGIGVWFQPQVRLSDFAIVGVEALARWPHTATQLIAPGRFIPVAEETGLIATLGRTVLAQACSQAAEWRREPALSSLGITVNLSARQLTDPALCDMVIEVLDQYELEPKALCLEVTESALVSDLDRAAQSLDKLHNIGVRLAIDDFGTGYATLENVRRFSMADELKIDQSFVADLERGLPQDRAIVSATIVLARGLGMSTVAEGVETKRQLQVLSELGCDFAEGYLFSPALPRRDLEPLLRRGHLVVD